MANMIKIQVESITYNWHQANDGKLAGEDYSQFEIGKCGVSEIKPDMNDQRLAIVYFTDGSKMFINNVNTVKWKPIREIE